MEMADVQRVGQRAAIVCQTCKVGKRQCDKRLPACARCKKLGRSCEYPASSPTERADPRMHSREITPRASPNACTRCRMNKRKCDRIIPVCSRCLRIGANCTYQTTAMNASASSPLGAGADMDEAQLGLDFAFSTGLDAALGHDPPIAYRPYMSQLLQFFLTSIALPSDTVVADSLAHHLRSQWVQHAMSDPCLFHATLFSASASIDMMRGQPNSTMTLYHQTWAIRLINERLAEREPILTYGTLGAVIPLLYYNMVALDRDSAVTHQKGLVKMLLQTPKSFRAEIGPLIAIVKLAMISFACIYDMRPIWDCLYSEYVRPNMLLRCIVSRASLGNGVALYQKETIENLLDVYEATSRLEHLIHSDHGMITAEVERVLSSAKINNSMPPIDIDQEYTPAERINACCQLACQAFWKTVRHQHRYGQMGSTDEVSELQKILKHLQQLEPLYWIRNAPEMFAWVAFTGAAASTTQRDRVAFVSHAGTILTAIDGESLTLIRQGWRYFSLLRRLGGHGEPLAILDDD
ncbi:hypothetical protein BJY01DRAFT_261910 [Aspergillus pseudoustus]|uniref:Zn(2)-C6 fungal-type domain-containing protein n=1 Tax=Aspergillus pseudoustus TaxID=1810923 RepID=A0ABR4KY59_9EURO